MLRWFWSETEQEVVELIPRFLGRITSRSIPVLRLNQGYSIEKLNIHNGGPSLSSLPCLSSFLPLPLPPPLPFLRSGSRLFQLVVGERCKLPQRVLGSYKSILVHFCLKIWNLIATTLTILPTITCAKCEALFKDIGLQFEEYYTLIAKIVYVLDRIECDQFNTPTSQPRAINYHTELSTESLPDVTSM